jgi:hypothetical protein
LLVSCTEGDGASLVTNFHLRHEDSRTVDAVLVHNQLNFTHEQAKVESITRRLQSTLMVILRMGRQRGSWENC